MLRIFFVETFTKNQSSPSFTIVHGRKQQPTPSSFLHYKHKLYPYKLYLYHIGLVQANLPVNQALPLVECLVLFMLCCYHFIMYIYYTAKHHVCIVHVPRETCPHNIDPSSPSASSTILLYTYYFVYIIFHNLFVAYIFHLQNLSIFFASGGYIMCV